jgi:hypothetical protein
MAGASADMEWSWCKGRQGCAVSIGSGGYLNTRHARPWHESVPNERTERAASTVSREPIVSSVGLVT